MAVRRLCRFLTRVAPITGSRSAKNFSEAATVRSGWPGRLFQYPVSGQTMAVSWLCSRFPFVGSGVSGSEPRRRVPEDCRAQPEP